MSVELTQRAIGYCKARGIEIDIENPLGRGQDGKVWKSKVRTAIKVLHRYENYYTERECYQRFAERDIYIIEGLAIPRLVGFSDDLHVIEMEIVSPPYLLDFGKAYIDRRAPFDEEQIEAWHEELKELFGDDYDQVCSIVSALWTRFRIHYLDAKPANICFRRDD